MSHTCIANTACRGSIVDDNGARQPAFTERFDALCDACTNTYRDAIKHLGADYEWLRITLGEHRRGEGAHVHWTPTPGVLIDTTSDRYMTEIVEWAEYAADLVSDALNTDRPDGNRKLAQIRLDSGLSAPEAGSLADRTSEDRRPPEERRLDAYLAMIEPHIEALAAEPKQTVQIWAQPQRCAEHAEDITAAKRLLELARESERDTDITEASEKLQAACSAAGACDECCGWAHTGQARQEADISGLDVLQRLVRLHHLIRKHLGQTKLRYKGSFSCPHCGSPVGRDDGTAIWDCENDQCTPKGRSSWTEYDYRRLSGLVNDEKLMRITAKYLLAEAYTRLDNIADLLRDLGADERVNQSEAVKLILGAIGPLMDGHVTPEERKIATDKRTATQFQDNYDENWAWRREPRYEKPKRRRRKPEPVDASKRIAQSSRSTITDTVDVQPLQPNEKYCEDCEYHHAGECA